MSGYGSDAAVFTVTPVNDPPVLNEISGGSVNYTENAVPVQLSSSVTVSDIDNTTLVSAVIIITAGLQTAEDVLSFSPAGGISGGYDAPSGTLSLSGVATTCQLPDCIAQREVQQFK